MDHMSDDGSIVCEGLVRIFTAQGVEVQALQGLELRMSRGEMVALIGASGSGKSTLLGILAGLDRPTAGSARVAGHDLVTMRDAERLRYRRQSVGFVWQQSARNLLPYLSARENIAMVHEVAIETDPDTHADAQLIADQERAAHRARIDEAMSHIAERYRLAIELRLIQELPREDCAKRLGITIGTFDVLLFRAVRAFRKHFGERVPRVTDSDEAAQRGGVAGASDGD